MYSEPLSAWKPRMMKGKASIDPSRAGTRKRSEMPLHGGHELVLRDLVHKIDLVQTLLPVQVALMDRIHSQKTRPTRGMRLAALPDAYLRRPCPGHRQATAPVRCRLAKPVQMTVREPRQTLEPDIAEHRVLALHHAPSDRAAQTAQGLVHLGQQTDVRLRVAPGETDASDPGAGPRSAPYPGTERSTARSAPRLNPVTLTTKRRTRPLSDLDSPNVARTHQNPPHETVRIGSLHEPEGRPARCRP